MKKIVEVKWDHEDFEAMTKLSEFIDKFRDMCTDEDDKACQNCVFNEICGYSPEGILAYLEEFVIENL